MFLVIEAFLCIHIYNVILNIYIYFLNILNFLSILFFYNINNFIFHRLIKMKSI